MNQRLLFAIDGLSTWVGKAVSWLIVVLMCVVCVEVIKRYLVIFIAGIAALIYSGWIFAVESWRINEHSTVTAEGPPVWQFKFVIPIAGVLVMIQGLAEIVRCAVCLRTGEWPSRLKDVAEIDVVEEQLAHSQYVDEESRKIAIEKAKTIDEVARQRGMGGDLQT